MKNRITLLLVVVIVLALAFSNAVLVYLVVESREIQEDKIHYAIEKTVSRLKPPKVVEGIDGKDGVTPIKGVDYFDGKDGKDSKSTHTVEKETVITERQVIPKDGVNGKDGRDALQIELRCNTLRNRLEQSYVGLDTWQPVEGSKSC